MCISVSWVFSCDFAVVLIGVETRDGPKKSAEGGLKPVSEEMRLLNKAFSRAHAMTIHLNLVSVVATVAYGFVLAGRMSFA